MTTALVPITDMERMALAFSKSGMFGAKTPDQALALLLLAQAEGQHPAIAMRDFDVIQGRPAKKSEAMLRSFLAAGGKVEWHQYDDNGASATFSHPQGGTVKVDWDAARAKRAGLTGKDNYQKYARAMYRSRVISEGCKTVYPAATSGLYVPEEVRQIVREEKNMGAAEVLPPESEPEPDATNPAAQKAAAATPGPSALPSESEGSPSAPGPVTRSDTLLELCKATGTAYATILRTAEVNHADELSEEDYASAVRMLRRKLDKLADRVQA